MVRLVKGEDASAACLIMQTYHIHIGGLVQGVGFRPFVCRLAEDFGVNGYVLNGTNGVHIEINAIEEIANKFYIAVINEAPVHSVIERHELSMVPFVEYHGFSIKHSEEYSEPDLLLTPDIAMCEDCRKEIHDKENIRYQYPFTTCLHCGPRFSIIHTLPYDRHHTTMEPFQMCSRCEEEYLTLMDMRFFSQTNSCPDCAIPMHLYGKDGALEVSNPSEQVSRVINELKLGNIVAVKNTGGYLLLCDATDPMAVRMLRQRKQRPAKPFAMMYSSVEEAAKDLKITQAEMKALLSSVAPIVLCRLRPDAKHAVCSQLIAPGLDTIGWMLPSTPLLQLISDGFKKPLIATSANLSGSPILYRDEDALDNLFAFADLVLTHDREIVMPQDDSVMHFSEEGERIILRRSRGLAPNILQHPFSTNEKVILAMGADMKASFGLLDKDHLYMSQFLGDQGSLDAQIAYNDTLQHMLKMLKISPDCILADMHPGYHTHVQANMLGERFDVPVHFIQHHEAHFCSVLTEHDLVDKEGSILGIVWDGMGYGWDGQVWGGETFLFEDLNIERVAHLDYFPQLSGNKMNAEPRLSAISMLSHFTDAGGWMMDLFSAQEWKYYEKLSKQKGHIQTSSIGRMIDAVASIVGVCQYNSYEGQAAMQLEAVAASATYRSSELYPISFRNNIISWEPMMEAILNDVKRKEPIPVVAYRFFRTLASLVPRMSEYYEVEKVALSGGVFQNRLLIELINEMMDKKRLLYNRQVSPNDENIAFGQIGWYWRAEQLAKQVVLNAQC